MGLELEGYTLSETLIDQWKAKDLEEYDFYYKNYYVEATNSWSELPEWMLDGDAGNGPFDLSLNPSLEWHDE